MNSSNLYLSNVNNNAKSCKEYEELLLKRDQLFWESNSYMTSYILEFGEAVTANFELKVECIKKKKTIAYCRKRMNKGLTIDMAHMQEVIEQEMTIYHKQLKEMIDDNTRAGEAAVIDEYRLDRAKKIYRRLAKVLHPDINNKTSDNAKFMEIWMRITEAYQRADVDELEDLEALVRRVMDEEGDEGFEINLDNIDDRIRRLENQINEIITSEPYIYGELLSDDLKMKEYKDKLQEEHDYYTNYLESLKNTLDEMLSEGGAKLIWRIH